jgi:hypothetical protein
MQQRGYVGSNGILMPMLEFAAILETDDPQVAAAWIAAGVALLVTLAAAPLRLWVERRLQRQKVQVEYEYAQRTKLRTEIGEYHGRLHDAGNSLRYRLVNPEVNWRDGSMRMNGDYSVPTTERYYFRTTVYRFMVFMSLANLFDRAAIHVDNRIAEPADKYFVGYVKAMMWALTDAQLFKTEDYDRSNDTAHFYTDHLRLMCATALDKNGDPLDLGKFERLLDGSHPLERVLAFFDGIEPRLAPDTGRPDLRWDRLMVFRLLLMGFITTVGYDYERDDERGFKRVAASIEHPGIAATAAEWIPRFGLGRGRRFTRRRNKDTAGKLILLELKERAAGKIEPPHPLSLGAEPGEPLHSPPPSTA